MKGKVIELEDVKKLFDQHYTALCEIAYRIVNDRDLAEDIVQEFFYEIWKKKTAIRLEGVFYHYASRAVKNAAISHHRNKKVQLTVVTDQMEEDLPEESGYDHGIDDHVKQIYAIAELMPGKRRKIFLLNNNENLKYADIALMLGISINTVKTQIKLAYQFIREYHKTP